jgi:hypothetical protein
MTPHEQSDRNHNLSERKVNLHVNLDCILNNLMFPVREKTRDVAVNLARQLVRQLGFRAIGLSQIPIIRNRRITAVP